MSGKSVLGGLTAFQWKKNINKYSYFFVSPFRSRTAATCSGKVCDLEAMGQIPNQCKAAQSHVGWAGASSHVFYRVKAP